jgi:hypothetical protein
MDRKSRMISNDAMGQFLGVSQAKSMFGLRKCFPAGIATTFIEKSPINKGFYHPGDVT